MGASYLFQISFINTRNERRAFNQEISLVGPIINDGFFSVSYTSKLTKKKNSKHRQISAFVSKPKRLMRRYNGGQCGILQKTVDIVPCWLPFGYNGLFLLIQTLKRSDTTMFGYLNDLIDVRRVKTIECFSMYYCLCITYVLTRTKNRSLETGTTRNINVYKYAIDKN